MNLIEAHKGLREEWFVPHETNITLPSGEELAVDGIPFEGWGTAPGNWNYITEFADDGRIAEYRSWRVPAQSS